MQDKKQFEYVIGIDLGHGETSAAICPLQWDTPSANLDPVKDLEMGGNKKVIPSALTILDDGTAYIGDAAFNPEVLKKASVRICFKQAPNDLNGVAEQTMIRFMHEIYLRIRENNQALLQDGNHLVYIATPSGWDKRQQELYFKMAEMAGLPIAGVTKESRAAFVRAQQDTTSGLGKNVHKGAVVFDMGSSTLDFTYMNDENPNPIDFGYNCGASLVEKTIYNQKRDEVDAIRVFEKKYPKLVDYLLFQARVAKEKVYFDPTLPYKKTINFEDIIDDQELEDERFKFNFQPGQLDQMLKLSGYYKLIEDAMTDYLHFKIKNQPIYGVFMTGGASRMDFIPDLVQKCWGIGGDQIFRDTDPSLTISQGVAEVARIDLRTEGGDLKIADEIKKLEQSDDIFNGFVKNYGGFIAQLVGDTVRDTVKDFCESEKNESANYLKLMLEHNVDECVRKNSSQAIVCLQQEIEEKTQGVQQAVDDIVRAYIKQGVNVKAPALKVSNVDVGDINMDKLILAISSLIASNAGKWLSVAFEGLGWFLFGLPGLLVSLGIELLFGKTDKEKKEATMAKPLNKRTRADVLRWFDNWEKENLHEDLQEEIEKSVSENVAVREDIQAALKVMLEDYKKELKNARLLVE